MQNTTHTHVSSLEHASFNPAHSTLCRPLTSASDLIHSPARPVCCCLSFNDDSNPMDTSSSSSDTSPESSDIEEEDFQTVPMDDEHTGKWATQQYLLIPMPIKIQQHCVIYRQFGFKRCLGFRGPFPDHQ